MCHVDAARQEPHAGGTHHLQAAGDGQEFRLPPSTQLTQKYSVGKRVGLGEFSEVRQCWHRRTQRLFALKCYRKTKDWKDEVRAMRQLQHEHIVHFEAAFTGSQSVYIVMELMQGGNLYDLVCFPHTCLGPVKRSLSWDRALDPVHPLQDTIRLRIPQRLGDPSTPHGIR